MALIFYGIHIYLSIFDSIAVFVLEMYGMKSVSKLPKFKMKLQGFFYLVLVLIAVLHTQLKLIRM